MKTRLYPLTFAPIYKETIWGGRDLGSVLARDLPAGLIGESWEIAAHPNGMSVVENGVLAGQTLGELVSVFSEELLGTKGLNDQNKFPLLLKFIHAKEDLSVQVHPDDAYIRQYGTEAWGKTELWYILHAEPEAWIVWGLKPDVSKKQFAQAIQEGGKAIIGCLNKVNVKPGQIYPISAGLIHALGSGVVVAEIQQNSDTTYRVYDWDRLDSHGQPRELHIQQALEVVDFSRDALNFDYQQSRCEEHFKLTILKEPDRLDIHLDDAFQIITILEGSGKIVYDKQIMALQLGRSYLIPASLEQYSLSSSGIVLQCTLP